MRNKYPIFIPTKGRHDSRLTINTFNSLNISYKIVVEAQEVDLYAKHVNRNKIIVLPHRDKGLTVTRNWIWDYAESKEYERFWTFDDNIDGIFRLNNNRKIKVADGTCIAIMENYVDRYENMNIAGMNYDFFCKQNQRLPPFYLNTRVYSNMLIKTDMRDRNGNKMRNNLFYNDDTDLCLRVMKNGDCTLQFNSFLIGKAATMTVKGGMTDYYEATDKRRQFAEELVAAHPDVARITWKFGRWHHEVDYRAFKNNKLIKKSELIVKDGVNNYGMELVRI